MANALPAEKLGAALAGISAWRIDPDQAVVCPVCGEVGLHIIDQSARPYAEWYALTCTACGLQDNVHIPLAPPI
jgi:predicted RNA-binding Zn-ribbon protein involved in translation (DUF1610 family)